MRGAWHHFIWLQEAGTPRWYSCCCAKEHFFTGKKSAYRYRNKKHGLLYYHLLFTFTCQPAIIAICSIQICIEFSHVTGFCWGCLVHSDYKGLTCLHHAAGEGYTQTIEILLSANPKLLDKTDEDGVWVMIIWKSLTLSINKQYILRWIFWHYRLSSSWIFK